MLMKAFRVWLWLPELAVKDRLTVFRLEAQTIPSAARKALRRLFDPRGSVRGSRPTKVSLDIEKVSSEEVEL